MPRLICASCLCEEMSRRPIARGRTLHLGSSKHQSSQPADSQRPKATNSQLGELVATARSESPITPSE
eukprot:1991923-Amphidinium_carterae.1